MGRLVYSALTSLNGYVADADGRFDWAEPDEAVHRFANELEQTVGTHLYGRRMYDVMRVWDSDDWMTGAPSYIRDYAQIWRAADKIVYSASLPEVSTARTRLERSFDPDAVRRLAQASDRDLSIGGADLAGQAIKAGLVDELHLFVFPVVVGGGTAALPGDVRLDLELLDEHRFGNGVVHLHYRVRG